MRLTRGFALIVTLAATTVSLQAQGVTFVQKETRGSQSTTSKIQIDKDHMRSESRSTGEETAAVFDGPKQTMRMINITKKSYMEMTKADMERMGNQVNSLMAQMQQQLANMPPQQRAQMEQLMQGRGMPGMPAGMPGMPGAAAKVEYKQTGTDKVGQWTCAKYEGSVGGQKTSEVCTVDPKDLGVAPGDFAVAQQMAEFMKAMVPAAAESAFLNGTVQAQGYAGVPVRRTSFRNGAVESVSEITEIQKGAIPPSAFETPAGFKKEAMPSMGR